MSTKHNDSLLIETIKWLGDIGCDEPLNSNKRDFYGLISSNEDLYYRKNDLKDSLNFEDLDNIKSLEKFLSLKMPGFSAFSYDGYENADLMVIGDKSEGANNKNNKPFQGEVGKLLNAMLKAIGFDQSNTYYTNIYSISDNIDKNMINDIIKKQISIVAPKVIIMLGAESTKALTNTEDSIFHTRGQWYNIDNISKLIPAISMFHPRYVLVHPNSKRETWEDLKSVKNKLT